MMFNRIVATIETAAIALLVCCAIAVAAVAMHQYALYSPAYPYLAVDDALGNISYVIAEQGRYGFLSSPLQGGTHADRTYAFYNYGPWYFYFGAALVWLFGFSIELLRAIHPITILTICLVAYAAFRGKWGVIGASFFSIAILIVFHRSHWAMIRPDVFVSLFAVAFVVFASAAIRRSNDWRYWLCAGYSAGACAFTHLIAIPVLAGAAVLPMLAQVLVSRRERELPASLREGAKASLPLILGALLAILTFYASCHFRIGDQWDLVSSYSNLVKDHAQARGDGFNVQYLNVLSKHLVGAYGGYLEVLRLSVMLSAVLAWPAIVYAWFSQHDAKRVVIALLLPPTLTWTAYVLFLGFYPNYHSGYVILNQVLGFWVGGALMTVLPRLLIPRAIMPVTLLLAASAGLVFAAGQAVDIGKGSGGKLATSTGWVGVSKYLDKVLDPIPEGSTAWGSVVFGLEAPKRIQLVQFGEAGTSILKNLGEQDPSMAPDYLVVGYVDRRDDLLAAVSTAPFNAFSIVHRFFPAERYDLAGLVYAAPYGASRIYQRRVPGTGGMGFLPTISVYDPAGTKWNSALDYQQHVRFYAPPTSPTFRVGHAPESVRVPDHAMVAELPEGDYVFDVSLKTGPGEGKARTLIATSKLHTDEAFGELGPSFDNVSYDEVAEHAWVFARHSGGPLFLSQFDASPGASIRDVKTYRVGGMKDYQTERVSGTWQDLPPLSTWYAQQGVTVANTKSGAKVLGETSPFGYQVVSPPINVTLQGTGRVRLVYEMEASHVCVGVLDSSQQKWLAGPVDQPEIRFNTGTNSTVHIVMANCKSGNDATRSRFTVASAKIAVSSKNKLYVDRLVK